MRTPPRPSIPLLLLLSSCGWLAADEPVLTGVPDVEANPAQQELTSYALPKGVLVDMPFLAGQSWDQVRDQVGAQLGDIQGKTELDPRDGTEYLLERGKVRVKDGTIYLVHMDLPRPMRRGAALVAAGLPLQTDGWFSTTLEWRLRWTSGLERVRMGREQRDSEDVVWVEVLKWNPRNNRGR